jgi:hypothetical protein
LAIDAIETIEVIPPSPAALIALDVKHLELADEVAEDDGAFTGHLKATPRF